MKNDFFQKMTVIVAICVTLTFIVGKSYAMNAKVDSTSVKYTINNLTIVNDHSFEFDLYLQDTDPSQPFELSIIQAGILVNSEIINGGEVRSEILSGSSELNPEQQPTKTIFVKGPGTSIIKVAPKVGPGPGKGTIIKTSKPGTKICRIRVTNSVPFAKAKPNLTFCFTTAPYPTKVFQYNGRISNQITTTAENCVGDSGNPVLNE